MTENAFPEQNMKFIRKTEDTLVMEDSGGFRHLYSISQEFTHELIPYLCAQSKEHPFHTFFFFLHGPTIITNSDLIDELISVVFPDNDLGYEYWRD